MKRFLALFLCLILMVPCASAGMLKYLDQYNDFWQLCSKDTYNELIDSVRKFKTEHPLLMSDEWEERIISTAEQARDAFVPDYNTEYDPFENIELKWFGDHKEASPEDPCVILDGSNGLILSFCLPVKSWIYVQECTALINGTERLSPKIRNLDFKVSDLKEYETFYINVSDISDKTEAKQFDSVAFRFYGKNKDDHVDVTMDEETLGYFRQVTTPVVTDSDVKDVLWEWANSIDEIMDDTIIPAFATRVIRDHDYPIYPSNLEIKDYWSFSDDLRDEYLSGEYSWGVWSTYFFPFTIEEIHEPSEKDPHLYWDGIILTEGGLYRRQAIIILDHAITQEGWIAEQPAVGDTIIVAASLAGLKSFRAVFYLGYDKETKKLVHAFE